MRKVIFGFTALMILMSSSAVFAGYGEWRTWKKEKDRCVSMQNSCKNRCPVLTETYCVRQERVCSPRENGQGQICYDVCVQYQTRRYQDPGCLSNCEYICEIPETPEFGSQCEAAADCSRDQDVCSAGYCVDINDRFGDEYMH